VLRSTVELDSPCDASSTLSFWPHAQALGLEALVQVPQQPGADVVARRDRGGRLALRDRVRATIPS
jgi:hypothetical protein